MAELTFKQRKTVNVHWSDEIKGHSASINANAPGFEDELEIRNVENDGYATVTFPSDFTGESHIVVTGSRGGREEGTVTVT